MKLSRHVLIALLVGCTLLVSPALLIQFQEPAECANAVDPVEETAETGDTVETFQYEALSPDAQRAFDRARAADGSVIVSGERCPAEFVYTADTARYEIVKDGSRYVLTTYANDIVPEVPIAASVVAVLGVTLVGIGLATADEPATQFPVWASAMGLVTLGAVTAAVVLDRGIWGAIGATTLVTVLTLVASGAAFRQRRALLFGGALALLPAVVFLPLTRLHVAFVLPALLPLLLVGVGIGLRQLTNAAQEELETDDG